MGLIIYMPDTGILSMGLSIYIPDTEILNMGLIVASFVCGMLRDLFN